MCVPYSRLPRERTSNEDSPVEALGPDEVSDKQSTVVPHLGMEHETNNPVIEVATSSLGLYRVARTVIPSITINGPTRSET